MMDSGYFNNGNFRKYSYFAGGILQSWNGNSRWPWSRCLSVAVCETTLTAYIWTVARIALLKTNDYGEAHGNYENNRKILHLNPGTILQNNPVIFLMNRFFLTTLSLFQIAQFLISPF